MPKKTQRKSGITLVDLLVAVVILSIGLVALCQLYLGALWTFEKAAYTSFATQRASYEIDQALRLSRSSYANLTTSTTPLVPNSYPSATYTALGTGRGVSFNVDGLPGGTGTVVFQTDPFSNGRTQDQQLAKVTVTITWGGLQRSRSTVALVSYIAKLGT